MSPLTPVANQTLVIFAMMFWFGYLIGWRCQPTVTNPFQSFVNCSILIRPQNCLRIEKKTETPPVFIGKRSLPTIVSNDRLRSLKVIESTTEFDTVRGLYYYLINRNYNNIIRRAHYLWFISDDTYQTFIFLVNP